MKTTASLVESNFLCANVKEILDRQLSREKNYVIKRKLQKFTYQNNKCEKVVDFGLPEQHMCESSEYDKLLYAKRFRLML